MAILWAGLLWLTAQPLIAAELPNTVDPGAQRERTQQDLLEQEQRAHEDADQADDRDPVEGPAGPQGGNLPDSDQAFTLDAIDFPDSAFLKPETLEAIGSDYIDRPVTFNDLNAMLGRINAIYRQRGIITAAAYIPPQTIDDGVLRVALIEGRLGRYRIEGAEYTSESFLRGSLPITEGDVIDVPQLRAVISRLNRETIIDLRAAIEPGADTGESDIVISVREPPRYTLSAFLDNHGSESTGEWRTGAIGVVNGPLGRADQLTLYGLYAEGSVNGFLRYELPVNSYGGALELSVSEGRIEIIGGPFKDLDVEGSSDEVALGYRQSLLAGSWGVLGANARISESSSVTTVSGTTVSDFSIRESEIGLQWTWRGERSRWQFAQSFSRAEVEALGSTTEEYDRYPGSASWLYVLSAQWSVRTRFDWQGAEGADLPSSLTYQVGGPGSIRGYDQGAVSGGRGYRLTLGADYRWSQRLSQSLFVDYADVDQGASGSTDLSAVGTSLSWRWTDDIRVEAVLGIPLEEIAPDQDDAQLHLRATYALPL